jgi:hypothetical protein
MNTNTLVLIGAALLLMVGGIAFYLTRPAVDELMLPPQAEVPAEAQVVEAPAEAIATPAPSEPTPAPFASETVIGTSASGNDITAYHFGTGATELLFVGGIHGGYSYNTTLLGYELINYLAANPANVPADLRITVIPVVNPDGLAETVGTTGRFASTITTTDTARVAGRFNANDVDLNRNFNCDWAPESMWQSRSVSGGSAPESEPEAAALVAYVTANQPAAAVVWFSAEGRVYPSACGDAPSRDSVELAATYATAANYSAAAEFDAYQINGDFVNWLADQGVPAISVLLTDHTNPEWEKNLRGITAIINRYAN